MVWSEGNSGAEILNESSAHHHTNVSHEFQRIEDTDQSQEIDYPFIFTPSHRAKGNPASNRKHHHQRYSFSRTVTQLLLVLLSSSIFVATSWYAQAAFSTEIAGRANHILSAIFKVDVGSALAILRILQGLLSTCTTVTLYKAFENAQWALVAGENGTSFHSVLAMSPTTGFWGVFGIVIGSTTRMLERLLGSIRIILFSAIWVAGMLLFVRTSLITIYEPIFSYNATAGVGQFNGSYIPAFFNKLQNLTPEYPNKVLPYNMQAIVYDLVDNSMHSVVTEPLHCRGENCSAYLFTGGLLLSTPWPPTGFKDHPLANLYHIPAAHLEFKRVIDEQDAFSESDCTIFGASKFLIGIKFCVAQSRGSPGSIAAGVFTCTDGTGADGKECLGPSSLPNITATFTVYSRTASLVVGRGNFSVLSVLDVGPPSQRVNIDVPLFRQALSWLLDFNASAIPAPSSIAEHFWTSQDQLSNPYWSSEMYRTFQSILAFPLWLFNPNNFGNPDLEAKDIVYTLPPEFYTTVDVTRSYTKIVVDRGMFVAFLVLQGAPLIFVWLVLVWLWGTQPSLPEISSYPLIDIAFKASENPSIDLSGAKNKEIRFGLRDATLRLRASSSGYNSE